MKISHYIYLYILGLVIVIAVSSFQASPGYMDASYYYMGGLRLSEGYGFSEMVLWNFLDNPGGLPHPSHMYWMPLSSVLAAAGMWLTGVSDFFSARLGILAIAGLVPVLTASLGYSLTKKRRNAILSGLFAIFSFFYTPYIATTDSFALYFILGAALFLLLQSFWHASYLAPLPSILLPLSVGALSGLLHLTRPDGVIWFLFSALFMLITPRYAGPVDWKQRLSEIALCLVGYLIIIGPWVWRSLNIFGSLFPSGPGRALWLTNYNELFIYPPDLLSFSHWWSSGLVNIFQARLWAFGQNLQTAFAVQGGILLTPLILMGIWKLRRERLTLFAECVWSATFLIMTIIFPFAGGRGGFFHSGAAIQPFFWAIAPVGLDGFIEWGRKRRGWQTQGAIRVFQFGLVSFYVLLSVWGVINRVIGSNLSARMWDEGYLRYVAVEGDLVKLGAEMGEIVMVNDAPGFYIASRRPAISIPYGDLATMLDVASRYQARYLLVEIDQLLGQERLYAEPGDRPGLRYLGTSQELQIYEFTAQ